MNVRTLLRSLTEFTISMRRSGTTTLIQKVANENDVYVLVPTAEAGKVFGEKAVTFDELSRMRGMKKKPILFDNYTLLQLSELSLDEYNNLDMKIEKRNRLLKDIKDLINNFERENGKLSI